MTAATGGQANSSDLERDARLVSSDHRISPGEIAIGVIIGRTSEAFDFFVYGIASVLVFPAIVFPFASPLDATLYSFALFGLAFIARPVGTVIFLEIDRRYGRGVKLTTALFLLGTSTAGIAFMPTYTDIGFFSPIALALGRIGQGLALGGAWDGLASLLALNAPKNKRGWYAMMPQLGAPIGLIVASGLFAFFDYFLTSEDFLSWGWRYPFFVAFTINVVALFARLRLIATEEFAELLEEGDLVPTPIGTILRENWKDIVIGAFVPLASFALFHLVTIYPLSYVYLYTNRHPSSFLITELLGGFILAVAVCLSGVLADKIGRRGLLRVGAWLIAAFSLVTPLLLGGDETGHTAFIFIGCAVLGLSFGQSAGAVASGFSSRNRYTGSALVSDFAWLFGAGFAPLVALGSYERFGLWAVGAYLLSGAVCTLIALAFNKRLTLVKD